ncbi:MAG: UDP-2,3-diacylglucosamine diphosphatase [Acidobacteriota bacterium]
MTEPNATEASAESGQEGLIYLIGDSHIGLAPGDEQPIVDWLDRLALRRPRALYLNGDVFHYLIGDEKFFTDSVRNFFAKLLELKSQGIRIYYIEGNRDFFLKGTIAEKAVTKLALSSSFTAGSRRYLVIHGDMINDRDFQYRMWRRISKNPVTRIGVKLVPGPLARRFVHKAEQRLARSNFKHKRRLPIELMEQYGRKKSAEGFDMIVFGHFHHKTIVPAGKATVTVLPAWYETGEAMVVRPESGDYEFVKF